MCSPPPSLLFCDVGFICVGDIVSARGFTLSFMRRSQQENNFLLCVLVNDESYLQDRNDDDRKSDDDNRNRYDKFL